MKLIKYSMLPLLAVLLAGCASYPGQNFKPGMSEQEVIAQLGKPAGRYQDGNMLELEYPQGPLGQTTYMAHIDQNGKLVSMEQVLTVEKFASIKVGEATKSDVLRTIGHPAETEWLSLPQLEVWSYRYKEGGVWNSMMHVHFDRSGIVRMMQNGRDPLYDDTRDRR